MSRKLESLRKSIAMSSSVTRRPGLALGVQLRNEAWGKRVPGLPMGGENDDEPAGDDDDPKVENDRLRKQVDALRKQVENLGETPVARSLGRNLATAQRRLNSKTATLLASARAKSVELGLSVGDVLRQAGASEEGLELFGLTDVELLDSGTARAIGAIRGPDRRVMQGANGEILLGLLTPEDATRLLDSGLFGGSR